MQKCTMKIGLHKVTLSHFDGPKWGRKSYQQKKQKMLSPQDLPRDNVFSPQKKYL